MARPRTPLLSRDRIRDKALELIDSDGLAELSMRKLARELGVQAASLYSHYATKDEVLDGIADAVMQQVDASAFEREEWPAALAAWARSYRAALAAHPKFVPFIAAGPGERAAALRNADLVHGGLVRAGWPPRYATMIGAATKYLVLGAAMESFARGFAPDADVYAERYPNLAQAHLLAGKAAEIDTEGFELALRAFVDGLKGQLVSITS